MRSIKQGVLLAILSIGYTLSFAVVSVQVEPEKIKLGETFRFILNLDHSTTQAVPDLMPLREQFTIVGTERNMSYSIVNGQAHTVSQWIVLLTAKKTGKLTIPVLQIGTEQSKASKIEVTSAQENKSIDEQPVTSGDAVMLHATASQTDPFVNQEVIYTVRLYNNQRFLDAEYVPPRIEDGLLIPLGEGRRFQTVLNGQQYAVEEQQYAIFPQKSGQLTFYPPVFNAFIADVVPRRVSVQAKPLVWHVKPIPAQHKGAHWLPAKQVTLEERYDHADLTQTEGDTLVRTMTLEGRAVPAELLPPFTFSNHAQFGVYPDKPQLKNTFQQGDIVGRVTVKVTYLLNHAGRITIPAWHVPWFNVATGKKEMATLPARTLHVLHKHDVSSKSAPVRPVSEKVSTSLSTVQSKWHGVTLFVGSFILLGTVFLGIGRFFSPRFRRHHALKQARQRIYKACQANDPLQVESALLHWAALQWPESMICHVQQLTSVTSNPSFHALILHLLQACYSPSADEPWQGKSWWHTFRVLRYPKHSAVHSKGHLPELNPKNQ